MIDNLPQGINLTVRGLPHIVNSDDNGTWLAYVIKTQRSGGRYAQQLKPGGANATRAIRAAHAEIDAHIKRLAAADLAEGIE